MPTEAELLYATDAETAYIYNGTVYRVPTVKPTRRASEDAPF